LDVAMVGFLSRWIVLTLSVLAAAHVVPGIEYHGVGALLAASLLLGLFNVIVRPLLVLLSLPLVIATFGLFLLAINTALFYLTGHLVHGFVVHTWTAAFLGSLLCSLIGMLLRRTNFSHPPSVNSPVRGLRAQDGNRVIDV
jgi:putative membrane protein